MNTLLDEWVEAATVLAAHHTSEAAQRHARWKCHALPDLARWEQATPAISSLVRPLRQLMLGMQLYGAGETASLAAAAILGLARALAAAPQSAPKDAPEPAPAYNPGVES